MFPTRTSLSYIFFIAILLLCCLVLYNKIVGMYPAYMHDWAQADRLSIAINFYDRGMNFFKPATHSLYSINGITGVEFPIVSYMAAALGHVFGRDAISVCFRLLNITIACTGLFSLFLLAYRRTKSFWLSAFTPVFTFCSPVFTYYAATYMPDAAGASTVFIAFFFVLNYLETDRSKSPFIAIMLLTLATLIKTSTGVYLGGFLSLIALKQLFRFKIYTKTQHLRLLLAYICSFAVIAGYYVYNDHLNTKYNSTLFLARANPFRNWDQFKGFFNGLFLNLWVFEYFSRLQYIIIALLIVPVIYVLAVHRRYRQYLYLLIVFFSGAAGLLYLFGGQLFDHDYYIIPIVLPLVAFFLTIAVTLLHSYIASKKIRLVIPFIMLLTCIALFFPAYRDLGKRMNVDFLKNTFHVKARSWASYDRGILDSLSIPKNEKIAVLNEDPPNLALVYLDRRGYHIPPATWVNDVSMINDIMRDLDLHILVSSREIGEHIMHSDPAAFSWFFVPVAIREHVAVFRRK